MVARTRRFAAGFALVDAIVGAVILALSLVAVIGLTGSAISSQSRGEQLQTAADLVDERLNLVLALGAETYPGVFPLKGQCDEPFSKYSYEVALQQRGEGNPYLVTATVRWNAGGRPQELSAQTMVAPRVGDDPDPVRRPATSEDRGARDNPNSTSSSGSSTSGSAK